MVTATSKSFSFHSPPRSEMWLLRLGADGELTPGTPWARDAAVTVRDLSTSVETHSLDWRPHAKRTATHASASGLDPRQSVQAASNFAPWSNRGHELPGSAGSPHLAAVGPMQDGRFGALVLSAALPNSVAFLVAGSATLNASVRGGTLVPRPDLVLAFPTGPRGFVSVGHAWPAGVPAGLSVELQVLVADPLAAEGMAFSNAVLGITP